MDTRLRWLVGATILLFAALVGTAAGILTYATDHSLVAAVLTGVGSFGATSLFVVTFANGVKQL